MHPVQAWRQGGVKLAFAVAHPRWYAPVRVPLARYFRHTDWMARLAPSTFVGEVVMKQEITPFLAAAFQLVVGGVLVVVCLMGWANQLIRETATLPNIIEDDRWMRLGMKLFLLSEAAIFGAFFAHYYSIRAEAASWPLPGAPHLDTTLPAIATLILTCLMFVALGWTGKGDMNFDIAPKAQTTKCENKWNANSGTTSFHVFNGQFGSVQALNPDMPVHPGVSNDAYTAYEPKYPNCIKPMGPFPNNIWPGIWAMGHVALFDMSRGGYRLYDWQMLQSGPIFESGPVARKVMKGNCVGNCTETTTLELSILPAPPAR